MTDLIDKLFIPSIACSLEVAISTKRVRNKTELFLGSSQQCFSSFRERGQHTVLKHRPLEHLAGHRTEAGLGVGLNKNQFSFLLHHDKLSTSKVAPSSKKPIQETCEPFIVKLFVKIMSVLQRPWLGR